jgi:anti-sigma factor RsiW
MNQHVTNWLEAYHDGELRGLRLRQVEAHLAECAVCRAELECLQSLSTLLQESPAAERLTSPDRFVAQVGLRLARRPEQSVRHRVLETGWRLVPAGLLGAWAFVQAVFTVAGGVFAALSLGGGAVTSALPAWSGSWLTQALAWTGVHLSGAERIVLQLLSTLGWLMALNVVLLIGIGLLYWSWLASWWVRRRRHQTGAMGRTA